MKKILWAVFGLFLLCNTTVCAEEIGSIMFNPSRLGLYQQLRVTDTMKSAGNVKVTEGAYIKGDTTISSTGEVFTITNTDATSGTVNMPYTKPARLARVL